jgi:hypothetical protein
LSLYRFPLLLVLLPALACAPEPQEEPPLQLTVGIHDLSVHKPDGWVHLDHGLEHRFQKDLNQIAITELGPATPDAYLREIDHARELFRNFQLGDAQAHLDKLDLRNAFPGSKSWDEISDAYHVAHDGGLKRESTRQEIEASYDLLIDAFERMDPPTMQEIVGALTFKIDSGAHRELAAQRPATIGGREGMRVKTWDKMTHESGRSFLFVLNEGNVLAVHMAFGKQAEMQAAFDALAGSIEFSAPAEVAR